MTFPAPALAPQASDLWALLALALAAAVAVLDLWRRWVGPPSVPLALGVTALLAVSAITPALALGASGLTWAGGLRGVAGDLSATTVVLLLVRWTGHLPGRAAPAVDPWERRLGFGAIALAGWTLYATVLGSSVLDPYRIGWSGWALPAACSVIGALAAGLGARRTALAMAAALAAWGLGLMESENLWDALLDPWLVLFASAALLGDAARGLLRRRGR